MTTRSRVWTFAIVSLALFMAMLDNLVVITALPAIKRALGASVSDLEWTVNAYTLAFAVLMMTGSALGDRFGRKRVFLAGVAVFSLGSALAALSDSSTQLLISRAFQGLGAAFVTPLTLTILARAFPPHQRAAAIGLWSGISGLGLAIGPLVGGAIVNGVAWNAIFWINVPIGALVVLLGVLRLEESHGDRQPLDFPGLLLAGTGLFGITFGLIRGNALGWTSAAILASFVAGALLLAAFMWRERRAASPMLNLHLFAARGFSVSNGVGFLMSAGMFGSIFLLTLYIQQIQGASPLTAGIRTMPWTGTIMLVAPVAGIIAGRIGSRPVVLLGMTLQAAALLWIGAVAQISTPYSTLLPAFILGGVGMGLTFAPLSAAVINAIAPNLEGQASGAYNSIRELGGVFGIAILGAVFQHIVTVPTAASFMAGFRVAVFAGAGIVTAGVLLSVLLPAASAARSQAAVPAEAVA
ncbi:MAG TPA: DHA2 family efflux MFS transporter permease subunit [Chloroflexota bacterium]|nr:DHA2 family efflux MFS transporter permease subunit [Chloroflexota bacterium]